MYIPNYMHMFIFQYRVCMPTHYHTSKNIKIPLFQVITSIFSVLNELFCKYIVRILNAIIWATKKKKLLLSIKLAVS